MITYGLKAAGALISSSITFHLVMGQKVLVIVTMIILR